MNNNEYLCSDTESFLVFQILQKIFSWISKCKNWTKRAWTNNSASTTITAWRRVRWSFGLNGGDTTMWMRRRVLTSMIEKGSDDATMWPWQRRRGPDGDMGARVKWVWQVTHAIAVFSGGLTETMKSTMMSETWVTKMTRVGSFCFGWFLISVRKFRRK